MAFPFLLVGAIAGAAAGGGLAGLGANKNNQNIKNAVRANYKAIDANTKQEFLAKEDSQYRLGQEATSTVGQFYNAGYGKGASLRQVISQAYQDAALDSINLEQGYKYVQDAAAANKQNVYTTGKSQMTNVPLAVASGALSGAATGASIGGSIEGLQQAGEMTKVLKTGSPAEVQAVLNGVPVSALKNPAVMQVYNDQQAMRNLAMQSAKLQRAEALVNFGYSLFNLNNTNRRFK